MKTIKRCITLQPIRLYFQSIVLVFFVSILHTTKHMSNGESISDFQVNTKLPKFEQCEIPENEPGSLKQEINSEYTKEKQLFLSEGGW